MPNKRLTLLLSAALLLPVAAFAQFARAPAPTLCRVQVTTPDHPRDFQRRLTIRVRPGCPPGGLARVRLVSQLGGSLPDDPPGAYTLRPGQELRRTVLRWWHVAWLSASGKPYPVREEAP